MSAETCYLCGGTALPGWSELRRDSAGMRHGDESVCIHSLGARVAALEQGQKQVGDFPLCNCNIAGSSPLFKCPLHGSRPPAHAAAVCTCNAAVSVPFRPCPVHSVPR